jgi:hypothetical protein
MGDLDKNIQGKDPNSPYEKILVNPLEKDKKGKFGERSEFNYSTKSQALATLASFFKKILTSLPFKSKGGGIFATEEGLLNNVLALRQLLISLSINDLSHNTDFTEELSQLWHDLLEGCAAIAPSQEDLLGTLKSIKFFITQIENFPSGADHTLGFYLAKSAGKDWIPFPFMELLQDLHKEYQASPPISVLSNWISLLNQILQSAGIKS